MTVSLLQWCAVIGIFSCRMSVVPTNCECKLTHMSFLTLLYMFILLQCRGDIEKKYRSKEAKRITLSMPLESQ